MRCKASSSLPPAQSSSPAVPGVQPEGRIPDVTAYATGPALSAAVMHALAYSCMCLCALVRVLQVTCMWLRTVG
jgi:hypothetical protein